MGSERSLILRPSDGALRSDAAGRRMDMDESAEVPSGTVASSDPIARYFVGRYWESKARGLFPLHPR
jgi:hypothetical protein